MVFWLMPLNFTSHLFVPILTVKKSSLHLAGRSKSAGKKTRKIETFFYSFCFSLDLTVNLCFFFLTIAGFVANVAVCCW